MGRDEVVFVVAGVASVVLLLTSGYPFWLGLAVASGMFTVLWLLSLALRDASIVDIAWGPGFVVVAWFYTGYVAEQPAVRGIVAAVLVTVWGVRLAFHIGIRNLAKGEDFRYAEWRRTGGARFWWTSYFKIFLLQAMVLWIVASPLLLAHVGGRRWWTVLDLLGVALWAFGLVFESVADWQLRRFKADSANRGKVLQSGLWRMSRHPNYFGEAALWWGLGLLGLAGGGWLALLGPALMTFLLLRISGVAMLERAQVERKAAYAEYVASTPAFVPWPRRLWRRRRAPSRG